MICHKDLAHKIKLNNITLTSNFNAFESKTHIYISCVKARGDSIYIIVVENANSLFSYPQYIYLAAMGALHINSKH